jgi:hypothetical protein
VVALMRVSLPRHFYFMSRHLLAILTMTLDGTYSPRGEVSPASLLDA